MADTAQPQVVVVNPPSGNSESEPGPNSEQNAMAIQYGQMLEREQQLIDRISVLESRLESETGTNQALRSEMSALSSQLNQIQASILEAEAEMEEEAEEETDTISVTPTPEPPPAEPEPPPAQPPSLLQRICDRVNAI